MTNYAGLLHLLNDVYPQLAYQVPQKILTHNIMLAVRNPLLYRITAAPLYNQINGHSHHMCVRHYGQDNYHRFLIYKHHF